MGEKQREIWFDGRIVPSDRHDMWDLINHSPIRTVIVTIEQRNEGHYPMKNQLITEIRNEEELALLPSGEIVMSNHQPLLETAKQLGYKTCVCFSVDNRALLEQSWRDAGKFDFAVVDFDLPTNIPLELIIARLEGSSTVLLRTVSSVTDMEVAFGVMEKGSDGVLFSSADIPEIIKLTSFLGEQKSSSLDLHPLVVTEVSHVGMGVRACVDTTGLMTQDEGMILGSTSGGGIFVCSETHYLPYMNLRPFRVNAGAIHSYIWMPNNAAEYLSDLTVGSKVLCVNTKGETRELSVGRVKIEVRPLLLIKGEAAGRELNVIVQDDWHIRVMGADGKPRNASTVRPGEELLSYVCDPGRHVGIKVKETILER